MTTSQVLEERLRAYWSISWAWNGRSNKPMTTEGAIKATNDIIDSLGPHRRIRSSTATLQAAIIRGSRRKSKKQNATVLRLRG